MANKSGKLKVSIKGKKVKAKIQDESNECDGNACTNLPTVGIYNPGTQLCMYDGGKPAEPFHFEKFLIPVLIFSFLVGCVILILADRCFGSLDLWKKVLVEIVLFLFVTFLTLFISVKVLKYFSKISFLDFLYRKSFYDKEIFKKSCDTLAEL